MSRLVTRLLINLWYDNYELAVHIVEFSFSVKTIDNFQHSLKTFWHFHHSSPLLEVPCQSSWGNTPLTLTKPAKWNSPKWWWNYKRKDLEAIFLNPDVHTCSRLDMAGQGHPEASMLMNFRPRTIGIRSWHKWNDWHSLCVLSWGCKIFDILIDTQLTSDTVK